MPGGAAPGSGGFALPAPDGSRAGGDSANSSQEHASSGSGPQGASLRLDEFTGFLLRRAFAKATGTAQACLPDEAHLRHVLLVAALNERGALSQQDLSVLTGISPTQIVKLVDGLEAENWAVRQRNPADRRSYALRLTDHGRAVLEGFQRELDRADVELAHALTRNEVRRLKELLRSLVFDDPALTVEALSNRVGYLVARAHRRMRSAAEQALAPLGLHPRDFGVLVLIGRDEPCSQIHLAQHLGVTAPAVLAFVDDLERAGLVNRARNQHDRRSYDLTLTTKGRKRLSAAVQAALGVQAEAAHRLGATGDAELRHLLTKLLA